VKSLSILLSVLMLTALFTMVGSDKITANAESDEDRLVAQAANGTSDPGQVVAASGNNRFAVWQDNTPGNYDIQFRRSTDNGATWKTVINLSNNPGASIEPQITVKDSNVYVVWQQNESPGTPADIMFRRSTDNGATWKSAVEISNTPETSIAPQLAVSGANVYVAWVEKTLSND
jgi:hypothetical protein